MDDAHTELQAAERDLTGIINDILGEVAAEFAAELHRADVLTAAFSVSRIARMWGQRLPRVVRQLLGIVEESATRTAEAVNTPLPAGWDNLPGRYDDGDPLPAPVQQYVQVTEHLLNAVGDRLAEVSRQTLAEGVAAGETVDQLRDRMLAAFDSEGTQLGPTRSNRIARTEAGRAWNTAALGAARTMSAPGRPFVKQWVTERDSLVRHAHEEVNGQLRLLDEPFSVGGVLMDAPHDPTAPPDLTINCRCILAVSDSATAASSGPYRKGNTVTVPDPVTAAASGPHTGAMIALMPTPEDATRLTINGGELTGDLHLTLFYLGEGADWTEEQRQELIVNVRNYAHDYLTGPTAAKLFGANHWNPHSEDPAWVWAVGDDPDRYSDGLQAARTVAVAALERMRDQPMLPDQHTPWQPHVCAVYTSDSSALSALTARLGPVTFDRIRVAFAGESTDIPLATPEDATAAAPVEEPRTWTTPGDTALAFENEETGDGRVFTPGSLTWEDGPWPLQYAEEMLGGHAGAELCGSITGMTRDGGRITGGGVLYPNLSAGADAIMLLDQDAPLGVSVDLDDVDIEFVDRRPVDEPAEMYEEIALAASFTSASVLQLPDGSWVVRGDVTPRLFAAGGSLMRSTRSVEFVTTSDGSIPTVALRQILAGAQITAAAGDPDDPTQGEVVHTESAGDMLMRITRGRVRGATLVAMPAYNRARIVLDPLPDQTAACPPPAEYSANEMFPKVIRYVATSPTPVGAREVSKVLGIAMQEAAGHIKRALGAGRLVRLSRGLYVGASTIPEGITAAMSGNLELPIHDDQEAAWNGPKAQSRVLDWATDDGGQVNADKLGTAFLWRDPDADPATLTAYKLGMADVYDGALQINANGVYTIAAVLQGSMGGVDIPQDEQDQIKGRVETLYSRIGKKFGEPDLRAPWVDEAAADELEASARAAMEGAPPMPAAWFRQPTAEELPPGSGGVHYSEGRIFGWVAQTGEPHAGMPGKNLTIESLGRIDLSHFLRARFKLDDGGTVRAGAFTMNVGHHRDGAECETDACQFDNTRTVAGIVTVGMSRGGMWFSGAAAPYLSDWDRQVFAACQPSYHMKQGKGGRWQLRAVLSVPVPGHSSPLVAAFAERANLALAASAAIAAGDTTPAGLVPPAPVLYSTRGGFADEVAAILEDPDLLEALTAALQDSRARRTEVDALAAQIAPARRDIAASLASTVTVNVIKAAPGGKKVGA